MPVTQSVPVLATEDLTVELGGLPVLRHVSAAVRPGEAVALLGGNGSGKSTLVRAALGLTPHQHGSVTLFGTPVRSFRSWSKVGYVPQRSLAGLTGAKVSEVVAAGRLARRRLFLPASAADRAAVAAALEAVGLADRARSELAQLSAGQQQRVMIARALAGHPELLVLDEPIAGVDLESQHALADLLASRLTGGAAVLVVLHEVGPLARLIDRALVLRDGRVIHDGPLGDAYAEAHPGRHEHEPRTPSVLALDGTLGP